MGTLENVMNMKQQGMTEDQIIQNLRTQGISPKEISDALTQSQIKSAVNENSGGEQGMQPSMMGNTLSETSSDAPRNPSASEIPQNPSYQNIPNNQTQYNPPQEEIYQPQYPSQQPYSPTQDYYPQQTKAEEYYPQEEYDPYQQSYADSGGVDSIIEISEQVFAEKMKPLMKQITELSEIKTLLMTKMANIEERLRRMEKVFDQMQISIIEKVGNYGKGLDLLKKELEMVEDSFSKVVDKATDKTHKTKSKK